MSAKAVQDEKDGHWSHRLRMRVDELGFTQIELAERAGISRALVEKYIAGKVDNPRGDILDRLAKALRKSALWLQHGIDDGPQFMPVTYFVGAGEAIKAINEDFEYIEWYGADPARDIVANVVGTSAEPFAYHRDYILATRDERFTPETLITFDRPAIIQTSDDHIWLKTIARSAKPGRYDLLSINPAHDPILDVEIKWCAPIKDRRTALFD